MTAPARLISISLIGILLRKNRPAAPTPGRFACFIFDEYPLGMVKNMFSVQAGWAFLPRANFLKALAEMLTGPAQA